MSRRGEDEELWMSDERLRSAVEAAEVGTWHVDLRTGLDARDASLNRILGLDAVGSTQPADDFFARVHEDDRAWARDAFDGVVAGHTERYDVEVRICRPNGEVRWVRDIGRIRRSPDGDPIYATGAMTDITEVKLAQQALAESASFYRQTLESIPGMTFTNTPEGACEYVSSQWVEFTGVEVAAQHGDGWLSVLHPDDRERAFEAWRTAIGGRSAYDLEYRVRRADGEYEWFKVRGRAIRDASGKVARWLGTAVNVNDLKQTEAALRESEERFRTLADNMSQLAWMADARGHVFWYSKRWFDFTGTTHDDMDGWGWTKVHHPDHVERVRAHITRAWEAGEPWEETFPLRGKDGTYRWFLARALPIRDARGDVVRWLGTNTDITEQRAAEEALRDADRRKDEFLATLAHELRNPLAPIRSGLEVLSRARDEPTRRHAAETIERQLGHMVRLVDDLLDVARISRGQVELQQSRITLAEVVETAIETSRPAVERGRHELTVAIPDETLWLDGDLTRLAQVVANLLDNAAKYTPEGGRIAVDARAERGDVVIRVTDTGVGIDADTLPRVFELFARGASSGGPSPGGLGIGLSLVRKLVDMHGGTVSAESRGGGLGSTFELRLPRAEHRPTVEDRGPRATAGVVPRRVLVVDDNVDAAEMLAMMLELRGHETRTAHDGPGAIAAAAEWTPEVVFLDIGLPGMDGYEVARRLRSDPAFAETVLVALTGWGSADDKLRAREAGLDVHLTKPVDVADVDDVVARRRRPTGALEPPDDDDRVDRSAATSRPAVA
ncbi:MAG: PAS domain-containing protein [Labilithrix sp.]|nr:PAS domain-containing protein [Labilithrix sp.]